MSQKKVKKNSELSNKFIKEFEHLLPPLQEKEVINWLNNQTEEVTGFDETTQEELTVNILTSSLPFMEWVCSEFRYDGVNLWFRNRIPYTKEQLIKQYLNECG